MGTWRQSIPHPSGRPNPIRPPGPPALTFPTQPLAGSALATEQCHGDLAISSPPVRTAKSDPTPARVSFGRHCFYQGRLGGHKPVFPVVTFLTPLYSSLAPPYPSPLPTAGLGNFGLGQANFNCNTAQAWRSFNVYGHTKLKTPVLVRSLKLSNFGLR